jgi:hypothetical protein
VVCRQYAARHRRECRCLLCSWQPASNFGSDRRRQPKRQRHSTGNRDRPPSGSATDIYVWDIGFTTKNRGKNTDLRILVDINRDSNADGLASSIDASAAGVLVTVDLYNSSGSLVGTYTGTTNSQGVFQTNWIKGLANDTYTAEVIDLAHATFEWDPFNFLDPTFNDNDADGDGLPDDLFMLL